MPNWVYNGLTIEGPKEDIFNLVEQMNTPFTDNITSIGDLEFSNNERVLYSNPVFSFRNIIAPTDLEAYKKQPARSKLKSDDPNWWADNQALAFTDNSWYNWNIRNWGVKWDVAVSNDNKYSDTRMEGPIQNGTDENDPYVVYYNFNTAWGVAEEAMAELSKQYPKCLLTLSYEEETGWGGQREYLRGHCIYMSEYETKCSDCDATDCISYCEKCESEWCTKCNWSNDLPSEVCEHAEESEEGEE